MITGTVTPSIEAMVRLHIEDVNRQTQAIDVKIDTGFSDFMSLPVTMVVALGLPYVSYEDVQTADGSMVRVDVHSAIILWKGKPWRIDVHALGPFQLIGMAMLVGHDIRIRATDGGAVQIDLIP